MTDEKERIVALETNMAYVLGILAKREDYQSSVLKSLTTIELKLDAAQNYQKTCDAERSAHGTRIISLENSRNVIRGQAAAIGAIVSFVVSLLGIYAAGRHP